MNNFTSPNSKNIMSYNHQFTKIAIFSFLFSCFSYTFCFSQNILIGTYTNTGKSEGVYYYGFDATKGKANYISKIAIEDPSFLTIGLNNQLIYSVDELANKLGGVTAIRFNKATGSMEKLNSVLSQGDHPCHVTIDSKNRFVFVANYTSGSLKAIKINKDGGLDSTAQTIQHIGKSINASRQEKPHVHSSILSPDEKYLLVQDLGTDQITVHSTDFLNAASPLSPQPVSVFNTTPGSGPRHLTFHPKKSIAYSVQELDGTVNVMKFKNGKLTLLQTITMVQKNETRKNGAADIHISPDGKFLYASNRGEFNELVIYSIESNGTLNYVSTQSTMGKGPRNFGIDPSGNYLLVANQLSDEIVIFKRDQSTGILTDTNNRIKIGAPVCIKFIAN